MGIRKYILPVVAGVMAGMMVQAFIEKAIHASYPPPPGLDFRDKVAIANYMAQVPIAAMMMQLVNYFACSLLAGAVATLLSGRVISRPALVVGGIITLASVANMVMLPGQPLWFLVTTLLLHIPAALLGYALARSRSLNAHEVGADVKS
ncbi:MAG: hypothetical protein KF744_07420 [Taibaiella sp.]|nr:hypothetical protein [Taibaiella sp.]